MKIRICLWLMLFVLVGCRSTTPTEPPILEEELVPEEAATTEPTGLNISEIMATLNDATASADDATNNTSQYAWDLFVALNWPAQASTPWEPDPNKTIGDAGSVVWEGWKPTTAVFLANGAEPDTWETPVAVPTAVIDQATQLGLDTNAPFHNLSQIQQADGLVFKTATDEANNIIRYQLNMNQSTFDYVRDNTLYNINGQENIAQSGGTISFDWQAMEIKTSWMWLDGGDPNYEAIKNSYVVVNAYYLNEDGTTYTVGEAAMTGMHIASKALPNWVWMTFENIHNADYTQATIELGIPASAQSANETYQALLAGTVYDQYQLVGTQIAFTEDDKATLLANSQIESAFQTESSCITCHYTATISKETSGALRFSFVDTTDGNLSYYVGAPPDIPDSFLSMDFVWSLRLAQREN